MTALSIIFGFRDRDSIRVERCLASLARQTVMDFEVLFVDYGSQPAIANAVKQIVEQHSFARYIYTETRGYAWNRSHAINIGGKLAQGDYILTNDVDMVVPDDFIENLMQFANPSHEVHIAPYFLPQGFDDWHKVSSHIPHLERATKAGRGICLLATSVYQDMQGYDEYYRYYGVEDRDMSQRLRLLGIDELWLTDETAMFHQWHAPANFSVHNFIPDGVAGRSEIHYLNHQNEIKRNPNGWGIIHTQDNRPALRFVDADTQTLRDYDNLYRFNDRPADPETVNRLMMRFNQLQSGDALAINHAFFPHRSRAADIIMRWTNRLIFRISPGTRLDYPVNHLHNFVVNFIELPAPYIADHYLNLPLQKGTTVLVKA